MISQLHQNGSEPRLSRRVSYDNITLMQAAITFCAVSREAAPAGQERPLSASGAQLGKCGKCINCKQTGRKKACKLVKCQAAATAGNPSAKLAMLREDAVGTFPCLQLVCQRQSVQTACSVANCVAAGEQSGSATKNLMPPAQVDAFSCCNPELR